MGSVIPALFGRLLVITGNSCCRYNRITVSRSSQVYYSSGGAAVNSTRRLFLNAPNYCSKSTNFSQIVRRRCTGPPASSAPNTDGTGSSPQRMSLFAKFKAMYKDYWYVLLPVHVVTSVGWFGAFYQISTSGVDVGYYLRKLGINETLIKHVTDSGMGHITVAWALYKIATPARYAVTLGGTTMSINVLRNMGYIKPAKELMAKGRNKIQSLKDKQLPKQ